MEKLKSLLLERKHLYPELCLHKNFEKRLKWELIEVEVQDLEEYFIKMFYEGKKYPNNENNLLICKLLDIVDYVNLDEEPSTKNGEYPDVDVDYLPIVRDYLKNTWAPQTFGMVLLDSKALLLIWPVFMGLTDQKFFKSQQICDLKMMRGRL